jgi:hypothetical protein
MNYEVTLLYGIIKKIKGKNIRKERFFSAMQTKFAAGVEPAPFLRMLNEFSFMRLPKYFFSTAPLIQL